MFTWLKKGGKYSSFYKHRQFQPEDHELRRDEKHFTKGVQVTDPIPKPRSPEDVLAELEALQVDEVFSSQRISQYYTFVGRS
jgi:hypothetical protein